MFSKVCCMCRVFVWCNRMVNGSLMLNWHDYLVMHWCFMMRCLVMDWYFMMHWYFMMNWHFMVHRHFVMDRDFMMHWLWMIYRYVNMMYYWISMVIVMVFFNMGRCRMMQWDCCVVHRSWMVDGYINDWLLMVIISMVLFYTMDIWVMCSYWMSMCRGMNRMMLSRLMQISLMCVCISVMP